MRFLSHLLSGRVSPASVPVSSFSSPELFSHPATPLRLCLSAGCLLSTPLCAFCVSQAGRQGRRSFSTTDRNTRAYTPWLLCSEERSQRERPLDLVQNYSRCTRRRRRDLHETEARVQNAPTVKVTPLKNSERGGDGTRKLFRKRRHARQKILPPEARDMFGFGVSFK